MLSATILLLPISMCLAAPTVTEDQLRSLIQPLLDFSQTQSPQGSVDAPPLFASLASTVPLDSLVLNEPQSSNTAVAADTASQVTQISPANQQLAQLNLAGGITSLVKTALGSLVPSGGTAQQQPINPIFGNSAGTGAVQPNIFPILGNGRSIPAAAAPPTRRNSFNPLSFLLPGMGGGGMMNMSMMMRMMDNLMEMFF